MAFLSIHPIYEGYLRDESGLTGKGEKIAFPESIPQAQNWAGEALAAGKDLTFQGARTGLVGGALPDGGWILNFSRLQDMGPVEDHRIRVQAGVTLESLQRKLEPLGLRFPPSPTEGSATLGGIFGTNGGGPDTLKYGESSAWVEGLLWLTGRGELWDISRGQYVSEGGRLTLPDGSTLEAEGDLIDHLAGTEGRLGAALELELRLIPIPREQWALAFFFRDPERAREFGKDLESKSPKGLTAAEYLNGQALELLRRNRQSPALRALPELPGEAGAAVLAELTGEDCMEALLALSDRFEALGGRETMTWAETGASGVRKLRALHHSLTELLSGALCPGDFRGPPGTAGEWIRSLEDLGRQAGIPVVIYGHWFDCRLRMDPLEPVEPERWKDLLQQAAAWVLARGGSLRGQYGYGRIKRQVLGALMEEGEP